MNKSTSALCAVIALLTLSGCGTDPGERAASGAGIGAGTGAVARRFWAPTRWSALWSAAALAPRPAV